LPLLEAIATGIMSSQKSAPVAVTVISYVTKDVAQQGLFAIPAIVGQISQIFIGSALESFMARAVVKFKEKQAALPQVIAGGAPLDADVSSKLAKTDLVGPPANGAPAAAAGAGSSQAATADSPDYEKR
jgi:sodium/bile acid cotransporter 7